MVGHIKARGTHPALIHEPSNHRVEHRKCSNKTGQAGVIAKAKAEALRDAGFSVPDEGQEAAASVSSLSLVADATIEIRDDHTWTYHRQHAPAWLEPFLDVPDNATPPTAMTPVHPEATGSYGPALVEWAEEQFKLKLRWWQALAIVRILEHREDGSLCWPEVIMSCSRRSGKSVIVRLLALWRLIFAPKLFEEQQLIVHSASTLKIAKEPMRYATRWVEKQDNLKVVRNNNSPGVEDIDEDHRWMVVPSDKTAGLDTCMGILDEAWFIKPEVVDDDLEPSLLERISPQLLLISTAHRRATSLMRNRISSALAGEEIERVLILLWCAMPGDDPGDPETHRKASAHWTKDRAEYVARKYAKALAGEIDPEADDLDPMEGFKAQYLNIWPLKKRPSVGDPVIEAEPWAKLVTAVTISPPDAVAVEAWFERGVAVAEAWRATDGHVTVRVTDFANLDDVARHVATLQLRRPVIVGTSLMDHPAWRANRVRTESASATTVAQVGELQRVLREGTLRHDGSPTLTEQVLALRVSPGANGPRIRSTERADAVKAAMWAASAAATVVRRKVIVPTRYQSA